jgi:trk system potassium uptake protein TrkH
MRERAYLRTRYSVVCAYTGLILGITGLVMLTPLAALAGWPEEAGIAWAFLVPAACLAIPGFWAWRALRPWDARLSRQEGSVVVLLGWTGACAACAVPFMAVEGMNFTQGVFESVSGWTTTGLTVLDFTRARHVTYLWRSILQLAGGAGLAIFMLAAVAGPVGPGVGAAEGRDQLVPNVRQSARIVLVMYAGYAAAGTLAYLLVGMSLFDAVNHTFAAISTGGFSTHVENIAYFNSVPVEAVTVALMILGNLNFVTAWTLFQGKFSAVWKNGEIRAMLFLLAVSIPLLWVFTCKDALAPGQSFRTAVFEPVSALTTTGFNTVTYQKWNGTGVLLLTLLMFVGGGLCSTAGGIKQHRVYMLYKAFVWEMRRVLSPPSAVFEPSIWEADKRVFVYGARIREVAVVVCVFLVTYILGVLVLTAYGYGLGESLFEFSAALGDAGLSIGLTLPDAPKGVLWTETAAMFLGRLEFMVLFVGAVKLFRDAGACFKAK